MRAEIPFRNRLAQEVVPQVGSVPTEGGVFAHFRHRRLESGNNGRGEREGHVPDAQPHDPPVGMRFLELIDAAGDLAEKVGGDELRVVLIDPDHVSL